MESLTVLDYFSLLMCMDYFSNLNIICSETGELVSQEIKKIYIDFKFCRKVFEK